MDDEWEKPLSLRVLIELRIDLIRVFQPIQSLELRWPRGPLGQPSGKLVPESLDMAAHVRIGILHPRGPT